MNNPKDILPSDVPPLFKTNDFIVIGEVHGSLQNAELIRSIARELTKKNAFFTIAFEWVLTEKHEEALANYIQGGQQFEKVPEFFSNSDERYTESHTALLKWIREQNTMMKKSIQVITFDSIGATRDRELTMVNKLLSHQKLIQQPVLVVTGSLHARKNSYSYGSETIIPMTAILSQTYRVTAIFIEYGEGEVMVDGSPHDVKTIYSQHEGPGDFFDYKITVPHTDPAPNIIT